MTAISASADLLASVLEASCTDARDWLDAARVALAGGNIEREALRMCAGAGRRLGSATVCVSLADEQRLAESGLCGVASWSTARLGRAFLFMEAARRIEAAPDLVARVYRTGDNEERIALLGVLAALDRPERFLPTALEACRTHVTSVFEAIACANRYPADHFSDEEFNQMVLKALFIGVAIDGIAGLARRHNPELLRMATAYASERRAAGRPVPEDVSRLIALEIAAS